MIESMNIASWVKRWSELHPNKTAIIFEDGKISYLDLHRRVNRTCCWFQSLGVMKGDRVALMMTNCPEFLEIYLACARLGALFVPINCRLSESELDYTLTNCQPKLFIFGNEFSKTVFNIRRNPYMLLAWMHGFSRNSEVHDYQEATSAFDGQIPCITEPMAPLDPVEPHVIMYTSGTTGLPKGAVLSYRKTFFNCLNADVFFKINFDDIMLIVLPLFHSGGLFIQASPAIYKGATMIIHSKFNPLGIYEDIEKYKVTKFLGVPTIYKSMINSNPGKKGALSSLEICAIGGEKVTPGLMALLRSSGFYLRQIMGQTETSILLWASEDDAIERPGSVGKPVFHADVKILDDQGCPCGPGQVGEIVVRGPVIMTEYWQDPDKTKSTIKGDWLHTGDLCRMDEDGYYYLIDRSKDMYISGGENVYPAEVERVLRKHPGIEDIAVIGMPDETWGEVGYAFVITRPDVFLTPEEVISFCEGRLARYKWPRHVIFTRDFPHTALGKVRKTELKQLFSSNNSPFIIHHS